MKTIQFKPTKEEDSSFAILQKDFIEQYETVFSDNLAPHSVVIIPSLTLDTHILSKIKGHFYYEERMLCLLMLLKLPETHLTFVTSIPISPIIIDYYLTLLPSITGYHARNRLTLLSCYDSSDSSLTEKILCRPRLIERIKKSIPKDHPSHIVFFNVTEYEKSLALKLNMPIYGCDPSLSYFGTKSGSRLLFKKLDIKTPIGYENLNTEEEIIESLYFLKSQNTRLKKAVIKLNDGFSGDGNAIFEFKGAPTHELELKTWVKENLPSKLKIVAKNLEYDKYLKKFFRMGGIVEEFISSPIIASPSVQCRITPPGHVNIISTHDQCLGGKSGQVFLGATFPANKEYASELADIGMKVSNKLSKLGVRGRFGIDFISTFENDKWQHYAIEINLRKGGTTHPFIMLQFLTDGHYNKETGSFLVQDNTERYYFATDNLQKNSYKGLTPADLIDIVMYHGLHYDSSKEEGIMFHLISALSQFGKLGLVSIAKTPARAIEFYDRVVEVLDNETNI